MNDFRCKRCQKLLGKYRECEELEIKCPRCGIVNTLTQLHNPGLVIPSTCFEVRSKGLGVRREA